VHRRYIWRCCTNLLAVEERRGSVHRRYICMEVLYQPSGSREEERISAQEVWSCCTNLLVVEVRRGSVHKRYGADVPTVW
jgi:hypothetical protein